MIARLLSVLLIGAMLAMSVPAHSQNLIDRRQPYGDRHASGGISVDQAVQMAESRYRAKAVKVTTSSNGDRRVYQIRLMREGKVWTVSVDAETGDMS